MIKKKCSYISVLYYMRHDRCLKTGVPYKTITLTPASSLYYLSRFITVWCIFDVEFQSKLDDYQVRKNSGERLNQDQLVCTLHRFVHKLYVTLFIQRFHSLQMCETYFSFLFLGGPIQIPGNHE